jgi:hypothetical protein
MIRDLQYQSNDKKSGFRLQYFYRLGLEHDAGKQSLVFVSDIINLKSGLCSAIFSISPSLL